MCQYSKKLHCMYFMQEYVKQKRCEVTLEWVQSYLKDRTYPLCATESEKRLIRKRSKDFSLSHDDVLLYVGGKNEDARVVLFTEEDRTKAFSECHASKSGGHQGRDRTEDKLRHYYWPHMHLDIRHWVSACMHTYTCTINTHTHTHHTHCIHVYCACTYIISRLCNICTSCTLNWLV